MAKQREVDPYDAPHAPKERSGPILRVGIMAVLLAGAAAGWSYMQAQPSTPLGSQAAQIEEPLEPIQVADAGGAAVPEAIPAPSAEPAAAPAASSRREAPAPRAAAPVAQPAPAPVESIPAPATTVEPIAPAPVQQM